MANSELILDRYEPLGTAGEGGFGTVRIAWDPRIQRKVAIKTILLTELDAFRAGLPGAQMPSVNESGEQVTALSHLPGLDEARTAAMLADPRIVTVYDFEVRDRTAYLIMEYVEGITLTHLLEAYGDYLTLDMVAAVFGSVAGALTAAHASGVLHLDIKPDNILVNPQGQAKVTDFGLATLADASGTGTTGGGTIGYMPLEQIRREQLDARADEWSLAAVAYEMLSGDNPFRVQGLAEAADAIEGAELVLPSLCWKDLDEQADDVLFYALAPNRDERYETVADFADELSKFLGDPEAGSRQLALVVADALGLPLEGEGESGEAEAPGPDEAAIAPARPFGARLSERLSALMHAGSASGTGAMPGPGLPDGLDEREDDAPYYEADGPTDEMPAQAERQTRPRDHGRGPGRNALAKRLSPRAAGALARAFAAVASAFTAFFALSNMPGPLAAFGPGAAYVIGAGAAAAGLLAAIVPHAGALAAFCLLGIAIVVSGHPIVGVVALIAAVGWWYTVGHDGKAAANVALSLPLFGAIGGSTAVPLIASSALRPVSAIATTVFAIVLAFAFGSFGEGSLLWWNAFGHWSIGDADIAGNVTAMLKQPRAWAVAAGWLVAATAGSLLNMRGSRALSLLGIALSLAAVLVGGLAFGTPSPQLIVSASLATAALVALWL